MPAKKRTASPAQLRALARGRAKLKLARKRAAPKRKTNPPKKKRVVRRRNPDRALMRTKMLTSDFKSGRARPAVGRKNNPPHYVVRTANGARKYFDGAGWVTGKSNAAQFLTKAKASQIGHKVANATGKSVYVEAV